MKKRILALFCAILLLFPLLPSANALEGESQRAAESLVELGLVLREPDRDYQLEAKATRMDAAQLLISLSGSREKAKAAKSQHFKDVSPSDVDAANFVVSEGWMTPSSSTQFSPNWSLKAQEWCGALLRMLGFGEEDFAIEDAPLFAQHIGLISQPLEGLMTRGQLFESAQTALVFPGKDGISLLDSLLAKGVVSGDSATAKKLSDPSLSLREVADRHLAAVFQIDGSSTKTLEELHATDTSASGFFIRADGIALTNCHSIEKDISATVTLSTGEVYPIDSVLWFDRDMDLALIRVSRTSTEGKTCSAFAALELVGSKDIRIGDTVYALGSPLGLGLAGTMGHIGSTHHEVPGYALPCIVNSANISPGSSGGALLNEYGHVIALTTGAYTQGNNMYLALPVDPIMKLTPKEIHPKSLSEVKAFLERK